MIHKKKRNEYFFMKYDGKYQNISSLPSYQEVAESDAIGRPYILIPDNNVCINVSDLSKKDQLNKSQLNKDKVESFLEYIRLSKITVNPTWGLLERASKPGKLILDKNDLKKFEHEFWIQLHHYSDNDLLYRSVDSIDYMKTLLYPFYVHLLKIKLVISTKEPNISNAKDNLMEIYDFMNNMQIFLATVWQFALGITGGDASAKKFIKHDREDKSMIFRDLWGAAWDLVYLQFPHLFYGSRSLNKNYPQIIFVTDDNALATIGGLVQTIGNMDYGNFDYNLTSNSYDFPYWKDRENFLYKLSWQIKDEIIKRSTQRRTLSETEFQNYLDLYIDSCSRQIPLLTQEIKGFYDLELNEPENIYVSK